MEYTICRIVRKDGNHANDRQHAFSLARAVGEEYDGIDEGRSGVPGHPLYRRMAMRHGLTVVVICCFAALLLPAGCAVSPHGAASPPDVRPGDARSYYERGAYYQDRMEVPQAIADYTMAIHIDPNFGQAYIKRGVANMAADWEASVSDLDEAIRRFPGDYRLYFWRGDAHTLNDDMDRAMADYDRVIAMKPDSPEAYWSYHRKALRLEGCGRIRQAITAYEEFIEKAKSPGLLHQASSGIDSRVIGGVIGAAASAGNPFGAAVGISAALLPLLDYPAPRVSEDQKARARKTIAELREIERVYQSAAGEMSLASIAVGMSRRQVVARTLGDGYYITLKPGVEVAVRRSGNMEDRVLTVLRFRDDTLVSREDFRLPELAALPDVNSRASISLGRQKSEIEEELRQTGRIIFADDDFVAAVAYDPAARGKRILVFNFSGGKVVSYGTRSRRLW
jgi:hypothetical protein